MKEKSSTASSRPLALSVWTNDQPCSEAYTELANQCALSLISDRLQLVMPNMRSVHLLCLFGMDFTGAIIKLMDAI